MVISDGIPAVPRNRKPRNSVPNPSAEEKTTRNSVPLNKNKSKLSNSLPNTSAEENTTRNSVPWKKYRSKLSDPGWVKYIDPDCRDSEILLMRTWKCVRQYNALIGPSMLSMLRALGPYWLPNSYNSKDISKLSHSTYRYQ